VAEQRLTTLSDYVGVLRRRIWIVLVAVLVAVGAAYFVSSRETPAYEATAQVEYGANSITEIINPGAKVSSAVIQQEVATAAENAHTTTVANLTLQAAHIRSLTPAQLLDETSVTPSTTSTFITFAITDRFPARARQLATTYARTYVAWSNQKAVAGIQGHIRSLQKEINQLNRQIAIQGAKNGAGSVTGLNNELTVKEKAQQTWQTAMQSLSNNNAVTQSATSSSKVRPATTKNVAMGLGLGIVIGLVLISLAEALDTRIRRSDEISERLGLPLLTRIPIPPRSLRKTGSLGMLDDEGGLQSEAYRKLRINLDFANLSIKARTIMITSATEQEGKSTTVANLAIALARAGRRVVLVDLDLRKPFIDHFFDLTGRPGLTDVALGNVTLDQALWSIPFPGSDAGPQSGSLYVLPSGPMPPNPADLIESAVVSEVLLDLAERADVVLLDSAPLLPVSDGIVLSNKVDAMLVVVRGSTIKRPMLSELQRVLGACPCAKLGYVLTGAEEGEGYGYGYGYAGYGASVPVQPAPQPAGQPQPLNGDEAAAQRRQPSTKSP
jgi:capsular exopolysaccharide synthesis family protein